VFCWIELAPPSLDAHSRTRITQPVCAGGGPVGVAGFDPGTRALHAATIDRADAVSAIIVDRLPSDPNNLTVETAGPDGFVLVARLPADQLRGYRLALGSMGPIVPAMACLPDWTADTGFSIELQVAAKADEVGIVLRGEGLACGNSREPQQLMVPIPYHIRFLYFLMADPR
jgi:hypothetical protein